MLPDAHRLCSCYAARSSGLLLTLPSAAIQTNDIYSAGVVLLELLTGQPAPGLVREQLGQLGPAGHCTT